MSTITLPVSADISSLINIDSPQTSGGFSYPLPLVTTSNNRTGNPADANKVDIMAFTARVVYTDNETLRVENNWSFDAILGWTPAWPGGALQAATYLCFTPDFSTKDTTKKLKIVENTTYVQFLPIEVKHCAVYGILTRDTGTGLIDGTVPANVAFFRLNPGAISDFDRSKMWYSGSIKSNGYKITGETSPPVTGAFFRLANGSALTLGRNQDNDQFDTCFISDDPIVTGGQANASINFCGRGVADGITNGGQFIDRKAGTLATANLALYEPNAAMTLADLQPIPSNKWVVHKILYFPASRLFCLAADAISYTSAANAIQAQHIYDTSPYNTFNKWLPTLHLGYIAAQSNFVASATWASNAGRYQFYDVNKLPYNG